MARNLPIRSPGRGRIAAAIGAAALMISAIFGLATATWASVPPDKIALHYTGGPFQGTHFIGVVHPGTRAKFYGLMEHMYMLPATQRTYIISKDPQAGDIKGVDFLSAPSTDNVQFTFEAAVYFKLNPKPAVIRQFFEQICLHDNCTDLSPGGGWDRMLAQYFRPQIENAVRIEVGKYDREHIFHDPGTLVAIQNSIAPELNDLINQKLGGDFFCGPDSTDSNCTNFAFLLKNPTPPDNVVKAYADSAAAAQNIVTAENDARAKVATARGDADAQAARAGAPALSDAQIQYLQAQAMDKCAGNSNCTLIIGGASAVNVNTGKK